MRKTFKVGDIVRVKHKNSREALIHYARPIFHLVSEQTLLIITALPENLPGVYVKDSQHIQVMDLATLAPVGWIKAKHLKKFKPPREKKYVPKSARTG